MNNNYPDCAPFWTVAVLALALLVGLIVVSSIAASYDHNHERRIRALEVKCGEVQR